jgi:hypothetical protein
MVKSPRPNVPGIPERVGVARNLDSHISLIGAFDEVAGAEGLYEWETVLGGEDLR